MKKRNIQKRPVPTQTPDNNSSLLKRALALHNQGKISQAQEIYLRILKSEPRHIDALHLMGALHLQQHNYSEAIDFIDKTLHYDPSSSLFHNNKAVALLYSGDTENAEKYLRSAIDLDNSNEDAHINLGNLLQEKEKFIDAIEHYCIAISINKANPITHVNLGNAYRQIFDFDAAKKEYEHALEINPEFIDAYNCLGLLLRDMGNFNESLNVYKKALNLDPENDIIRWNMGLHDLMHNNYINGWQGYEHGRYIHPPIRDTLFINNEWHGEVLDNKSIIIYGEQGIGDEIMFASCIHDIMKSAAKVYIACDKRLAPIFERSFPHANIIQGHTPEILNNAILSNNIDYSIPTGSLPYFLRRTRSSFINSGNFLIPDVNKTKKWKERYSQIDNNIKIGISWCGGKKHYDRILRSTKLEAWADLLKSEGITIVNLQYGDCQDEISSIYDKYGIKIHDWDDSDPIINLDDFFSKINALDLVISIDNSTAHIAGSIGKPTWILLPATADWRWTTTGTISPWYPSLRLIRQTEPQTWENVFIKCKELLLQYNKIDTGDSEQYSTNNTAHNISPFDNDYNNIVSHDNNVINTTTIYIADNHTQSSGTSCAIITPVGPGHTDILNQCEQSIHRASAVCTGNFTRIIHMSIDDTNGSLGRSLARNMAIQEARANAIDWLFFLDADDLMAPNSFEIASLVNNEYDAIWGRICSFDHLTNEVEERSGQLSETSDINDIIFNDPYLTLQMGHYVKTSVAYDNLFNEKMNCGEDFDYYLRIWRKYKCIRTNGLLFINRRGLHSSGPRSADGNEWRSTVEYILRDYCVRNNITVKVRKNNRTCRFKITNPFDLIQRHYICGLFFEEDELEYIRSRIPKGSSILEIGANIGNHTIYYDTFMSPKMVITIEPNPDAISILLDNITLNNAKSVVTDKLGIGVGAKESNYNISECANNLGASQLISDLNGNIKVYPADDIINEPVDFIKIDVENMEIDVLTGSKGLIQKYNPLILVEVMRDNFNEFYNYLYDIDYVVEKEFQNTYASNFFITPKL